LAHYRVPTDVRPRLRPALQRSPADLWVEQFAIGIHVTRVPCREPSPHDLHVLLRHRLLRKPGGLEGFVPVGVPRASHDEAVTQGPKVPDANVEPRAAGSPTSGRPNEDEHPVVRVPEPLRLQAKLLEHLGLLHKEPNDVLAPSDWSLPYPAVWNPFHIGI